MWNENQVTVGCLKIGWLDWAHNKQDGNFLQQKNGGSIEVAKPIGNHIGDFRIWLLLQHVYLCVGQYCKMIA